MATIDADDLLPNDHVKQLVLEGEMTQIHRGNAHADPGDTFEIDGTTFAVTDVADRTLGDMTDEDARAEGSEDLTAYRERMERAHGGDFEWDEDAEAVRHRFERRD